MADESKSVGAVPPNDVAAEAAVISAVILDDQHLYLDQVREVLYPEFCYSPRNRNILASVYSLSDEGQPTDLVTVANHLRSHGMWDGEMSAYLAQVVDGTPSVPNVVAHAVIVRDMYRVRRAILAAQGIASGFGVLQGADPTVIQSKLEEAELYFSELAMEQQQSRRRDISDVMSVVLNTLQDTRDRGTTVIGTPTGYRPLDEILTGLHDGDETIVAGRPGTGKTAFALGVALRIASAGYGVLFNSLEMPAEQLGLRLLAMQSGVDLQALRTGRVENKEWPEIIQAVADLSSISLQIDDTAGATLVQIRGGVRQFKREIETGRYQKAHKGKIGAVFVDYVQLMRPVRPERSREQEIETISHGVKQLAKDERVHPVLLSQLNREPEKRNDHRPKLSDLRNSGALEQDADNVIFLHRPEMYDKKNQDLVGLAEVLIEKQRNGPTGLVEMTFDKARARYELREKGEYDDYEGFTDGGRQGEPD